MYAYDTRVSFSQIDEKGNLSIVSLINLLQDCCSFQAEDEGVGLSFLTDHDWGWYITNWDIHIFGLPAMGDVITVATWPYEFKGMFGNRNFLIKDAAGKILVEANSMWLLMDLKKQRPVRIPNIMLERYELSPKLRGEWGSRKIAPIDGAEEKCTMAVMPAHLDTNHHLNNAYYIEFARDLLEKGRKVFGIRTEYKKPALLGDELTLTAASEGDITQVVLKGADDVYAVVNFS